MVRRFMFAAASAALTLAPIAGAKAAELKVLAGGSMHCSSKLRTVRNRGRPVIVTSKPCSRSPFALLMAACRVSSSALNLARPSRGWLGQRRPFSASRDCFQSVRSAP
jgi:hypothetical protein